MDENDLIILSALKRYERDLKKEFDFMFSIPQDPYTENCTDFLSSFIMKVIALKRQYELKVVNNKEQEDTEESSNSD